ncbi:hypothetical protein LVD17_00275 [Fulvivirga ulvae]|uniref:hypothetical protein n=1 Tax=Fulvivirga ulvae TaxID=2904245 RepID=UPI001F3D70A8|nr:hypothetical protein [Fulvivirga ulvae]UII32272.1 hypothetical protein LVD17_00275 [Fulvivirga ulvae]
MTVDEILGTPKLKAAYIWFLQNSIRMERAISVNVPIVPSDINLVSNYDRSLAYLLKVMRPLMNDELIIVRIDEVYERLKSTIGKEGILKESTELLIIEEVLSN